LHTAGVITVAHHGKLQPAATSISINVRLAGFLHHIEVIFIVGSL